MQVAVIGLSLIILIGSPWVISQAKAEEYMKRGATVDDYQQALGRVLERKRGIVTARERQQQAARQKPSPSHSSTGATRTASSGKPARIDTGVYVPDQDQERGNADGVSLYFGYDSAELTRAAQDELRKLGQALRAPEFAGVYWLIEGHTDASGAGDYNQRLSEARASSARRFLIETAGIAPDKLITVGKGESELYDSKQPAASVNRRVRLRPIGEESSQEAEKIAPAKDEDG
jgi:outer membrane protein OmpA-like peptidoglycan-associated protein